MNKIEVSILNPLAISEAEQMMVLAARLTQRGEGIHSMEDFGKLQKKPYSKDLIRTLCDLPHPTIQKFGLINVAVVGASRRFLAQITRHQNEVKFMSASLQYSNYSTDANFCIPYELLSPAKEEAKERYLAACNYAMLQYRKEIEEDGASGDTAGYTMPQGLRGALIMSATPYQWKHMISQRTCHRNTDETRYIMLKIWEKLFELSEMFNPSFCGPFCVRREQELGWQCPEGKMWCGCEFPIGVSPSFILEEDFPIIFKEDEE